MAYYPLNVDTYYHAAQYFSCCVCVCVYPRDTLMCARQKIHARMNATLASVITSGN